ncbi:restriction endonuclease subunit S [Streptomyces sp. NPDC047461]|uniref:restriction endonuclease subunit S n=1 Tax=Streptomyces sp. NPDC047461 TaxID=3155619 RepID=UPI0033FA365A
MPNRGWNSVQLEDVLDSVFAGAWGESPTDFRKPNVRVLRATNIDSEGRVDYSHPVLRVLETREISRKRLHPGDILLEASGGGPGTPVGRVAVHDVQSDELDYICSNFFRVLRPNADLVHPAYLAHLLVAAYRSPRIWRYQQQTTGLVNLKLGDYLKQSLWIPPVHEQARIVEILAGFEAAEQGIDASISKFRNVRHGALLTSMASVGSENPASGWARVPLKSIVPSAEYGVSEALDRDARGVPVLRMNNIQSGRIDADDLRYCPVPVPAKLFLRGGDVLFNRTNSMEHIGKAAMWRDELPSATFASYLVRLVPDLQRVTPEYLVEWLMHPLVRQRVRSISTVAVQQVNVNPTRLRELEIDLPVDLAEQRRIVAMLEACDEQIGHENEELNKLRELKRGLVDDLLSGRRATASGVAA